MTIHTTRVRYEELDYASCPTQDSRASHDLRHVTFTYRSLLVCLKIPRLLIENAKQAKVHW